jgi:aryl-alcohol dehydrogenase-like predicted oxidoreductase
MATRKKCKPSQLALAWVLAQGQDVVPIPGTKKLTYLEENAGAAYVALTDSELREIDEAIPHGIATGERYPEEAMRAVNR